MDQDLEVHYDDKGKFFTEHRVKEKIPVIIQTSSHKIFGTIEIPPSNDITKELNSLKNDFLTVFDAAIQGKDKQTHHETETLTLNRNQIIWVINNIEEQE